LLFGLPRFSEQPDFSLENGTCYDPLKWMEKLKRDLALSGFEAEPRWSDGRTVHVAGGGGRQHQPEIDRLGFSVPSWPAQGGGSDRAAVKA